MSTTTLILAGVVVLSGVVIYEIATGKIKIGGSGSGSGSSGGGNTGKSGGDGGGGGGGASYCEEEARIKKVPPVNSGYCCPTGGAQLGWSDAKNPPTWWCENNWTGVSYKPHWGGKCC